MSPKSMLNRGFITATDYNIMIGTQNQHNGNQNNHNSNHNHNQNTIQFQTQPSTPEQSASASASDSSMHNHQSSSIIPQKNINTNRSNVMPPDKINTSNLVIRRTQNNNNGNINNNNNNNMNGNHQNMHNMNQGNNRSMHNTGNSMEVHPNITPQSMISPQVSYDGKMKVTRSTPIVQGIGNNDYSLARDLNNGSNTTVQSQRHGQNHNSDSYIVNHKSNTKIIHDNQNWPDRMRRTSLKLGILFFLVLFFNAFESDNNNNK